MLLRHMWLFASPMESTWPLANHTGTSNQNGFSISIQAPERCRASSQIT
jgi:hypothetical protein